MITLQNLCGTKMFYHFYFMTSNCYGLHPVFYVLLVLEFGLQYRKCLSFLTYVDSLEKKKKIIAVLVYLTLPNNQ